MPTLFPMSLDIEGKRVLVVGGGEVALRKVELLVDAGAAVVVVSPEITAELSGLAGVEFVRRPFEPGDLDGAVLVIAATNNRAVNEQVCREAHSRGLFVNVVDKPDLCDFHVPASIRRGKLCVAISTGGSSPMLSRKIRRKLEEVFPAEYGQLIDLLGEMRPVVLRRIDEEAVRKEVFEELTSDEMLRALADEGPDRVRSMMLGKIEKAAGGQH